MHAALACSLLIATACAHPAPRPVGNRDRTAPPPLPGRIDRPRWAALPVTTTSYATLAAGLRAPPRSCLAELARTTYDRAAFFAMTAAMIGTRDRCTLVASRYVAELALVLDREGPGCRGDYVDIVRAWTIAAALTAAPTERRIALRNRAEAKWRQLDRDWGWTPARGAEVARAFRDASRAGDRDAGAGEIDAWVNALRSSGDVGTVLPAARARVRRLGDRALARRLHDAIDGARMREVVSSRCLVSCGRRSRAP